MPRLPPGGTRIGQAGRESERASGEIEARERQQAPLQGYLAHKKPPFDLEQTGEKGCGHDFPRLHRF